MAIEWRLFRRKGGVFLICGILFVIMVASGFISQNPFGILGTSTSTLQALPIARQKFGDHMKDHMTAVVNPEYEVSHGDIITIQEAKGPQTYPNWQERANQVVLNSCRMSPTFCGQTYSGAPNMGSYSARSPVQYNLGLNRAARNETMEFVQPGCPFQHNSCDGWDWASRTNFFYLKTSGYSSASIGENIAQGKSDPIDILVVWLNSSPHRDNIMSTDYREVGVGFVSSDSWTQDFGTPSPATDVPSNGPIHGASHVFLESGKTTFMLSYYDSSTENAKSVDLILSGSRKSMSVGNWGTASRGTYQYTDSKASDCREYFFEATTNGGVKFRYPSKGKLKTYGEGGCTEDYAAHKSTSLESAASRASGYTSVLFLITFAAICVLG